MRGWCRRRWVPLAVGTLFVVLGFDYIVLWQGLTSGAYDVWRVPGDLWGTWLAGAWMFTGHYTNIYATDPGAALLMAPVSGPGYALGLEVGPNYAAFAAPTGWILAGPWTLGLSTVVLFAGDALSRRWGWGWRRRLPLALAEAVVLFNVSVLWGHFEDAVAVGLVLLAVDRSARGRWHQVGWLAGAAVVVQPFALLALPALALRALGPGWGTPASRREVWGVAWRAVVPYLVALVPALVLAWHATTGWLLHQPNWSSFNHPTPFTSWAGVVAHTQGGVTSGPSRVLGLAAAAGLSLWVCRRRPLADETVLWAVALSFAAWATFEVVLDGYYTWPAMAVALLLAARRGPLRLGASFLLAMAGIWFSDHRWHHVWPWWWLSIGCMVAVLAVAGAPGRRRPAPAAPRDPGPEVAGLPEAPGVPAVAAPGPGAAPVG